MTDKIYETFKAASITTESYNKAGYRQTDKKVVVVTDDEDGLIIAVMPSHLKYPEAVAKAIAEAMTNSQLALTDLI